MAHKEKTYWPHMIVGFIMIGVLLGYWTVKSTAKLPVQKSNDFMMSYQETDTHYNDILAKQKAFDSRYRIELVGVETKMISNPNSNLTPPPSVLLQKGVNRFVYRITDHNGNVIKDADVTFLLTRPHTNVDDVMYEKIAFDVDGYVVENVTIRKPGRYELRLRVVIDEEHIGFHHTPAYLFP